MSRPSRLTVVGAGAMGTGLAAHCSIQGLEVTLVDHREANLDRGREAIASIADFHREQDLADVTAEGVLADIDLTLDLGAAAGADVVLESVSEAMDVKRAVFEEIGATTSDALLATNTSSFQISEIAKAVPEHADRVVGCHWWFPPYLLRPVEVVQGEATEPAAVERAERFVREVDRDPIRVERDVPGFVWNRVQSAVLRECLYLAEEGVASIEDINRAIRDGYARRTAVIGPFETVDIAGLDLFETVVGQLSPHLCDDDEPSELFSTYQSRGRRGVEAGAGFLEYAAGMEDVTRARDERLAALGRTLEDRP